MPGPRRGLSKTVTSVPTPGIEALRAGWGAALATFGSAVITFSGGRAAMAVRRAVTMVVPWPSRVP